MGEAVSGSSLQAVAQTLGVRYWDATGLSKVTPDWTALAASDARRRSVFPMSLEDRPYFVLARADDSALLSWLSTRTKEGFGWGLADQDAIATALAAHAPGAPAAAPVAAPHAAHGVFATPVVEFIDRIILGAWTAGASDIHFETRRTGLTVRIRLDGVLVDFSRWTGHEPPTELLSRLKVMADLDIAEKRVPQDGRFTMRLQERAVDFCVSVMPNAFGEDAVLRILDKRHLLRDSGAMTLDGLGFHGPTLQVLRQLSRRPHGMLLVTGPTGSGKTTTLYAALTEILDGREKVITIEDPIEYELGGALQIPVNERKGLTFARGLRSILRHDPDTVLVGEIRDAETADIAVQAALTGHLVFTTVHANDVLDVIGRFIHMNLDLFSLVSALNGVVCQRLVRLTCEQCAGASGRDGSAAHEADGRSCEACRGTGYRGRTVVSEVIVLDDRARELIVNRASLVDLKAHLAAIRTTSMKEEALALVASGRTDREEIDRVLVID